MTTTETNPAETAPQTTTFVVLAHRVDDVKKRVANLTRRVAKHGLSGLFTVEFGAERVHRIPNPRFNSLTADTINGERVDLDGNHEFNLYNVVDVTVTVHAQPSLGGWSLAGVISRETAESPINTVSTVPGVALIPDRFRTSNPCVCEHCNKPRTRTETFVLANVDGSHKQVGRQCLRDFLGHDPIAMLRAFDTLSEVMSLGSDEEREFMGEGSSASRLIPLTTWLKAVCRVIAVDGFTPVSAAGIGRMATRDLAANLLFTTNAKEREALEAHYADNDKATALFDVAMGEVMRLRAVTDYTTLASDYERNMYAAVFGDAIGHKSFGIVASIVAYAEKRANVRAERKAAAEKSTSKHVGTVGERLRNIAVTVVFKKTFDGMFGATTLLKFADADGNVFTWFASGTVDANVDAKFTLTGTVKAHETDKYLNTPVTQLSRCKLEDRA